VTGKAAPAAFDGGKPKVALLYDNARAFNEEPAAKLWTRVVANVRVELDARAYKYVQHKNKYGQDYTSTSGDRY